MASKVLITYNLLTNHLYTNYLGHPGRSWGSNFYVFSTKKNILRRQGFIVKDFHGSKVHTLLWKVVTSKSWWFEPKIPVWWDVFLSEAFPRSSLQGVIKWHQPKQCTILRVNHSKLPYLLSIFDSKTISGPIKWFHLSLVGTAFPWLPFFWGGGRWVELAVQIHQIHPLPSSGKIINGLSPTFQCSTLVTACGSPSGVFDPYKGYN